MPIANNIASILEASEPIKTWRADVTAKFIPDPHAFLDAIKSASRITKFGFTSQRPNPFDSGDFKKAVSASCLHINADEVTTSYKGEELKLADVLDFASQAAAAGDEAWATVLRTGDRRGKKVQLGRNPVREDAEEVDKPESRRAFLARIRDVWVVVRSSTSE